MSSEAWVRRVAFLVVVALVTAACGSTVPASQQEAAEEAAAEGLDVPGGGAGGGDLGGGDLGGGLSGGTTGSGGTAAGGVPAGGTTGGTSGDIGGSTGGTAGGTDSAAQGVTASTIELGMLVAEDVSAANAALSGGNVASGIDMRRAWEAIVDYVNKGGGIVGHKIKPVFHHFSATGEKTAEQNAQEACSTFTEDNKVFAALGAYIETETYYACIERGGAALINGQSIRVFFDDRVFPRYPHMILPFGADLNTQSKTLVNALVKQNYFTKGAKIGLLTFDDPGFVYATERTMIPELRRHGLKPTDWVRVSRPAQYGDYGRFSSEVGNAVVKFKSEGITHVMILDIGANLAFFFAQQAEKQQYRPRYGLTSQSGGSALADLLGEDARNQLKGARGIGWAPAIDLHAEDDNTRNGAAKRCLKIMRDAGVEMSSRNAEAIAIGTCDSMWFLQAALEAGGRTITLDSYLGGIDRLGDSYVSAGIPFGVNVSGSRHDGLGAVANVSFFGECRCFRYTSKPYSIPN